MDTLTADPPVPAAGASDQPDRSPSHRSVRPSGAPRPDTPEFEAWSGAIVDAGLTAGPITPLTVGPAVSSDPMPDPGSRTARRPRPVRRPRAIACLSVAIASLLCASGMVMAERLTGKDLSVLLADVIRPDADPAKGTGPAQTKAGEDAQAAAPSSPATGDQAGAPALAGGEQPAADGSTAGAGTSGTGATSGGTTVRSPRPSKGGGGSTAPATTTPTLSSLSPSGRGDTQPGAVPAPGGSDPGTPTPPADGRHALEHEVDALTPFVQDAAGHTFTSPVPVVILSDTQFLARYDQLNWHPKGADAERLEAVYRALGLIDANVDLASELAKLSRTEVVTLYDPVAGELLIRNREADPYLRTMLVHELTRALDDQHFDIYRPSSAGFNDEGLAGLKALAEGDATRVTDNYTATLSASDRSRVDSERQRIAQQAPSNINRAVKIRFTYFVAQGVNLVKAILGAGGRGRLDAAFAAPPVSSEQILEPSKYLANDAPRAVAEPAADGPAVSRGVLGQVGVYLMLAPATGDTTANKAAYGWGGDRYVSWEEGPKTCVRQTIVTDSAEDAAELGAALEEWRQKMPGAEVSGSGPFTIKRCA